jgi:arylsulfatase A-like enzyme
MRNLIPHTILVFAFVLAANAAEPSARPNILLIMTDQQFADAMSCSMGGQYIHTPAMDSLAARGMRFTRAYSPNPLCMPARSSIFSGRYCHETGVTENKAVKPDLAEFVCMGTYFRRAGYETAYFGKWHLCYAQKDANAHGFEVMQPAMNVPAGLPKKLRHDGIATWCANQFLARKHDKPFLMVLSYLNPHNVCELARDQELPCGPIGSPPPVDQCPPVPFNLAPQQDEPDSVTMIRRGYQANPMFPVGSFTPDRWRQHRWGYYRLIEKVDAEIGRVLAALKQNGLEDNTVIVFTSDHGECAGAHQFNQKTVFDEESSRVPLIVTFNGRTKPGTCDKLVNIGIDILPTLSDFAGIRLPEKLTGRSLRPLSLGQSVASWRDHLIIQNHLNQAGLIDGFRPELHGRMVRTDQYKYCVYSRGNQRESLVDLRQDPGESRNLARDPAYRNILLAHRQLLANFAREQRDTVAADLLAEDVKLRPFK